jgi:SAM-dependent methyltransferase
MGDGRGEKYDATHSEKVDAHIWDAFIKDLVSSHIAVSAADGGTRYLDFACGTGRVLKIGALHYDDCTGIDISADMLHVARERVPGANIICGDVTTEDLATGEMYDCVTLFRFLLNAELALNLEVLRWLADHMPQGAILIGNNHMNSASIRGIVTMLSNQILGTNHNHLSRARTTDMLRESGFKILQWSGYRVLPTIKGKPILGKNGQLAMERVARALQLGRVGSEQVFIAERI